MSTKGYKMPKSLNNAKGFQDHDIAGTNPLNQQFEPTETQPIRQHARMAGDPVGTIRVRRRYEVAGDDEAAHAEVARKNIAEAVKNKYKPEKIKVRDITEDEFNM